MDPCKRPYLIWPKSFRQLLHFLKKWSFYFTGSAFLPLLFYQECWEIQKFIALILLVGFAGSFYFQNKPLGAASAFTTGNCPRQPVACFFEWCKFVFFDESYLYLASSKTPILPRCFNLSQMLKY